MTTSKLSKWMTYHEPFMMGTTGCAVEFGFVAKTMLEQRFVFEVSGSLLMVDTSFVGQIHLLFAGRRSAHEMVAI
jgi:hypothetical protein